MGNWELPLGLFSWSHDGITIQNLILQVCHIHAYDSGAILQHLIIIIWDHDYSTIFSSSFQEQGRVWQGSGIHMASALMKELSTMSQDHEAVQPHVNPGSTNDYQLCG